MYRYNNIATVQTTVSILFSYSTNQLQLKQIRGQNAKKTRITCVHMQKSNFACAYKCYLNNLLNGYTAVGSLLVGTLKY